MPSMTLLGKFICGRLRKQKSSDEGSKARLIERAGRRKHLPVWSAEHLSDPAHIRWFPCLRYLAAAPCVLATIGCPGPLLFPTHSLIIRRLVIPQSLCFHQNEGKIFLQPPWSSLGSVYQTHNSKLRLTSHLCPHNTNKAALTTAFLFLLVPILGLSENT